MRRFLLSTVLAMISQGLVAQSFEISRLDESYKGSIGETIHAPIRVKNTSDKQITLILKRADTQIGSTQKHFFCPDNNCLEQRTDSYTIKLEPGQTLQNFSIGLAAGLSEGTSTISYTLINKANPADVTHLDLNFLVEGKREKNNIYVSSAITVHDIYPNPVATTARLNYSLHSEKLKAKIIIHNILGTALLVYDLPASQTSIKIDAERFNTGMYFYTLYLNNEGIITRKLMVKK